MVVGPRLPDNWAATKDGSIATRNERVENFMLKRRMCRRKRSKRKSKMAEGHKRRREGCFINLP